MARKRATVEPSGFTILVVDDKEEILTSTRLLLEKEGHRILTASNGEEALALFHPDQVHLVIVDYFMPEMSGVVVQAIRQRDADVQILLQTGYSGEKPPRKMLRSLDIQGYHDKSEGPERLLLWVDVALKEAVHLKQVKETEQLKTQLLIKEHFLTNVSHEMRTPLSIILGYSEILLDDTSSPLPAQARQQIERIQRQADNLRFLVNNFLDLAKIGAETMTVALQAVCLSDLQGEVEELMRFLLVDKAVAFVWQVSAALPAVQADRQKLLVILRNFLSNAAKFTERGEVQVMAALAGSGEEVEIKVQDSGIGIAPEYHELIFELFRQVDSSSTRHFGGTGIGLALARKLADLMGGEIAVESAPGMGSTFTLKLKVAPVAVLPASASVLHTA